MTSASNFTAPQLSGDDIFAGTSLLCLGVFGMILHSIEAMSMLRLSKVVTGFLLILPLSLAELLLLIEYGILPGLVILIKDGIIPENGRIYYSTYTGACW